MEEDDGYFSHSGIATYFVRLQLDCWRRQWHPTPVLLPGKSHGWQSLVGCRPWGREESDMTEQLHFQFSLSCIGEGNGNPPQCSCLENPRDGGAWWAAIYGVAQSQTRLKRLSRSSKPLSVIKSTESKENITILGTSFIYTKLPIQFSSVTQLCLTLCHPMNCSTPSLPVYHQLPEFTQTHVH